MKKYFFLSGILPILFFATYSFAQAPQLFNYQGIARDAAGNPLANQVMGIKLSILPAADANLAEYEEIQTVQTNEFGLYTLQIGNGKALSGNIKNIQWETGNKYIKVGIDPTGGNHYVDAGTNQLLSVPYAIYADKAGVAINNKTRTGSVNSEAAHVAADANYLTKFTGLNTIGKSSIYQSPATGNIGIGTNNPTANAKMHIFQPNLAGNTEYLRMQNLDSFAFGKFILYNDIPTNYSTFTKYGSKFPGGYAGIISQYPFANMLAFGNNLGPFLLANNGDVGIGIVTGGSTKLYLNARQSTGYLGIGGSALPSANVHINSSNTGDTVRITNATTGHLNTDGLEIRNTGNAASIINKENSSLDFGTSNTTRMSITPNGNVGIGILNPVEDALHIKRAYSSIRLEDSNDNVSLYLVAPDPSTFTTGGIGTSSFHELPFWTNNIERMVIKADGKIGIGTNTPSTALDVNGQIKIQGGSPGVGKVLTSDATGLATWEANSSPVHFIGESYGGGIVFYVYDGGHHGLIAATVDQSVGITWNNGTNRFTGTAGDGLGAGNMNTSIIVSTQIADNQLGNFAAKICNDFSLIFNGINYGDWYLPSLYELNLLYLQKNVVGGFSNDFYWSSTEIDNISAWRLSFANGFQNSAVKVSNQERVRAIRNF